MSHSTIRAHFSRDAKQCGSGCSGRSQLFVQRSGSDDVEGMVDLKGIAYTQLKNALRYRTEYVRDCTCRGNPWDPEAIARHRAYAEEAKSAPNLETDKNQSRNENQIAVRFVGTSQLGHTRLVTFTLGRMHTGRIARGIESCQGLSYNRLHFRFDGLGAVAIVDENVRVENLVTPASFIGSRATF
jgi:hypothetical protein